MKRNILQSISTRPKLYFRYPAPPRPDLNYIFVTPPCPDLNYIFVSLPRPDPTRIIFLFLRPVLPRYSTQFLSPSPPRPAKSAPHPVSVSGTYHVEPRSMVRVMHQSLNECVLLLWRNGAAKLAMECCFFMTTPPFTSPRLFRLLFDRLASLN